MEMSVTHHPAGWPPSGQPMAFQSLEASQTGLALLSNTQHMDVSLVTAEGDKVTLSLDARAAALSVINEQMQADGQGKVAYEKNELSMGLYQRDMTFSVEGDLSEAEMRDINKVLKSLDKMMTQFVNGQMVPMAAQAGRLKALDTIAGLEANFSYQSQVLVAHQSQLTTIYTQNGLPAPGQPPATPLADEGQYPALDDLAQDMAEELQSTATPAYRIMQFVDQLMEDYRQQATGIHERGRRMIDRVHHKLHHALEKDSGPLHIEK